ncbi:MAG TPA: hypothetical protein VF292_02935 [Rhodanobacteraceae bacterium]
MTDFVSSDTLLTLPVNPKRDRLNRVHAWVDSLDPSQSWALSAVSLSRPRSLKQNATVWRVYGLAKAVEGDTSLADVVRECKLNHGAPILCAADAEYARSFEVSIGRLAYEDRLRAMDYWPVTRLMNMKQTSQYIDAIQQAYGVYARSGVAVAC